jgi:hypothetical protein
MKNVIQTLQMYLNQPNYGTIRPVFIVQAEYPKTFLLEQEAQDYIKNSGRDFKYVCCALPAHSSFVTLLKMTVYLYRESLSDEELAQARNIGIYPDGFV